MTPVRLLKTAAALAIAAVALAAPASAGIFTEEHAFYFSQPNPSFDTTYSMPFDLPKFDTQGGTRQLLAVRVASTDLQTNYTYSTLPNFDTEAYHSVHRKWHLAWSAEGESGSPSFPMFYPPPSLWEHTRGRGVARPPLASATGPFEINYDFAMEEPSNPTESLYDAAGLAQFTGTGTIPMTAELAIGPAWNEPFSPPGLPVGTPVVFDPDMLQLNLDLAQSKLWVWYLYSAVPEPGSLALLSLGALGLLRRR